MLFVLFCLVAISAAIPLLPLIGQGGRRHSQKFERYAEAQRGAEILGGRIESWNERGIATVRMADGSTHEITAAFLRDLPRAEHFLATSRKRKASSFDS